MQKKEHSKFSIIVSLHKIKNEKDKDKLIDLGCKCAAGMAVVKEVSGIDNGIEKYKNLAMLSATAYMYAAEFDLALAILKDFDNETFHLDGVENVQSVVSDQDIKKLRAFNVAASMLSGDEAANEDNFNEVYSCLFGGEKITKKHDPESIAILAMASFSMREEHPSATKRAMGYIEMSVESDKKQLDREINIKNKNIKNKLDPEWFNFLEGMQEALSYEKVVNQPRRKFSF